MVSTSPAYACTCLRQDPAQSVQGADGAFVGTYLGRSELDPADPTSAGQVLHHFSVEAAIKGDIGRTIDVRSPRTGAACGLELAEGQRTGLLVQREGESFSSILCFQTAAEEMLVLVQPTPALPTPGAPTPAGRTASPPAGPAPAPASPAPAPSSDPSAAAAPPDGGGGGAPVLLPVLVAAILAVGGLGVAMLIMYRQDPRAGRPPGD